MKYSYLTYSYCLSTFKHLKEKEYKHIYKMIGIINNCSPENLHLPGYVEDEVESFVKNLIPNGYQLDDNILSSFDIVITPQTLLRTFCQRCSGDIDQEFVMLTIPFLNTSASSSVFITIMKKLYHVAVTRQKLNHIHDFVVTPISLRN